MTGDPEVHPFRTAWATRDVDGWARHFASRASTLRGLLLRAMSPGLRLFMTATDAVATKLVQPRG